MKKPLFVVFAAAVLMMPGLINPKASPAGVNINISIPLPGLYIPGPPALVVVPGTYVYYPPEVGAEIFFYHGYWYRPYGGGWYIAGDYNGPWRSVGPRRVPRPLMNMPPGYRRYPPGHERMPYPVVQRNWRSWENERHWDNDRHERREMRGRGDHGRGEHEEHGGRGRGRGDWRD